ncbi:MAG TPA: hypothetical protein VN279_07870 [Rhodocyclaceae bacterium]|nr:hypothetical protein [Rhodocyclaceae bacterium]
MNAGATWGARGRWVALTALFWSLASGAAAETPQEFAKRLSKTQGVSAVANLREDQTLGSIAIGLLPELLADRAKVEPLLGEIGSYAAAGQYRATVVTPTQADNDFVSGKLRATGVAQITPKVMADFVSIKTSRIFLIPKK